MKIFGFLLVNVCFRLVCFEDYENYRPNDKKEIPKDKEKVNSSSKGDLFSYLSKF